MAPYRVHKPSCSWCRDKGHYSMTAQYWTKPIEIICSHCEAGLPLIGNVTAAELDAMAECPKCEDGLIEYIADGSESKTERGVCDCALGKELAQRRIDNA